MSPAAYKPIARALHWIIALIVAGMLFAGLTMVQPGLERSYQDMLFIFHKNTGVIVLLLMLWRLAYRLMNPPPPLPASIAPIQARIAGLTHGALYLLLFVMAVSGYIRVTAGGFPLEGLDALGLPRLAPKSEGLANAAKAVHFFAHYALMLLIVMHVGAALFHGIVKRDGVFSRMWPG